MVSIPKGQAHTKSRPNVIQGPIHARTAFRPRQGVGFHHSPRLGVAGKSRARQDQGNHRNKQLVNFDPEIERTLTRNRNMVRFQRALQGSPSVGNSSENFTELFSDSGEEVIQDNMADREHNDQRRTLRDYITPTTVSCSSSVVRPAVE
ncbi:hypothetical protein PIB30_042292, partial [Stylosanthes scabra]|nr:hypothetical protein [Stylosanthes scabra]